MIELNTVKMISVLNILHDSIVDGSGLRTVIFFSGCPHQCHKCQNPQGWDIKNGKQMSIEEILSEIQSNKLTNKVTLSGGDPFYQSNEVQYLAEKIKQLGFNLWAYTGYTYEELLQDKDDSKFALLKYCDVIVDGKFQWDKKDLTLAFRGSSNQRVINVQKSLKSDKIIEIKL